MTYIAKPVIDDSDVLNHIARDLVITKGETIKLHRRFKLVTEDGIIHEVSFTQLDGLLNILDSTRDTPPVTPLQYLVQHYGLQDLVDLGKDDWIVPTYDIAVLADTKTVRLEGLLTRVGYVEKEFFFALGEFDFIQQLSLARCIAGLNDEFKPLIGTFDVSYMFTTGPDGMQVTTDIGV